MINLNYIRITIIFILIITFEANKPLHASPGDMTGPDHLQAEIGMSFIFDACGDPKTGEEFRAIYMKWLRQCPFDDETKKSFSEKNAIAVQNAQERVRSYYKAHNEPPEFVIENTISCKKFLSSDNSNNIRKKINLYKLGDIMIDEIIMENCDKYNIK